MTIEEKTTYTATSLPYAPPRETREEAEADEARGIELAAYLAVLPTLTKDQWERVASQSASQGAAWDEVWDEAWYAAESGESWPASRESQDAVWERVMELDAPQDAAWAALAIIVRDLITPDQFDTLTAPMRAAGVNFDALANHNEREQPDEENKLIRLLEALPETTERGFRYTEIPFRDYQGSPERHLSIQESSLATEARLWVGFDTVMVDLNGGDDPKILERGHLDEATVRKLRDTLTAWLDAD